MFIGASIYSSSISSVLKFSEPDIYYRLDNFMCPRNDDAYYTLHECNSSIAAVNCTYGIISCSQG